MIFGLNREEELAQLIAEQEQDMLHGDTIRYRREASLDAPISAEVTATLADVVGEEDIALAELLGENETWIAMVEQKHATDGDVNFWLYLQMVKRWSVAKIADHVGCSPTTVRSRLKALKEERDEQWHPRRAYLTKQLTAAAAMYERGDHNLHTLAEALYREAGYGSAESCYQQLRRLFHASGVRVRPKSWKHGKRSRSATREEYITYWKEQNRKARLRYQAGLTRCERMNRDGTACRRWAMRESRICVSHARHRRDWTAERICEALARWTNEHGRPPRPRDWSHTAPDHPSFKTVYDMYGSWPHALREAECIEAR